MRRGYWHVRTEADLQREAILQLAVGNMPRAEMLSWQVASKQVEAAQ